VVTSWIFAGIILLMLFGLLVTPIVAGLWIAIADLVSHLRPVARPSTPAQLPNPSTEAMWHQMQGTSKRSRRRAGPNL
jgi:hypothetical protein